MALDRVSRNARLWAVAALALAAAMAKIFFK